MNIKPDDIEEPFRTGKKGTTGKFEIMKGKRNLKGTIIYINEGLPYKMRVDEGQKRNLQKKIEEDEVCKKKMLVEQSSEGYEEILIFKQGKIQQKSKKLRKSPLKKCVANATTEHI